MFFEENDAKLFSGLFVGEDFIEGLDHAEEFFADV